MFILASASPRRKELFKQIVDEFKIDPSDFDESAFSSYPPLEATRKIAFGKGEKIAQKYPNDVVISADTIVVLNNELIGKPKDKEDARNILRKLSGKKHEVITSYCVFQGKCLIQNEVISYVIFNELADELIDAYIATGSPLDKAGAYGVQDNKNFPLVKEVIGSLDNVIGFPVKEIRESLKALNLK